MSGRRVRERRRYSDRHEESVALPADIDTHNSEDERIVKLIIERAQALAKDAPLGTEVSVDVKDLFGELSTDLHAIVGQVMFRTDVEPYGLLPGPFENDTFYFIKM